MLYLILATKISVSFSRAMKAQLSCYMQNFPAINLITFGKEQNDFIYWIETDPSIVAVIHFRKQELPITV